MYAIRSYYAEISFTSGQYVQLVVPPYGTIKESVQRAYSMASRPGDSGRVELLIRLVPGGIATTYVHTALKVGDRVELVGPFGDFRVRDTPAAMVCVAGGSGMAPFKSMFVITSYSIHYTKLYEYPSSRRSTIGPSERPAGSSRRTGSGDAFTATATASPPARRSNARCRLPTDRRR